MVIDFSLAMVIIWVIIRLILLQASPNETEREWNMAIPHKLSFGIKTSPQFAEYDDMKRVWLEADQIPVIEHAWLFDHFMPIGNYDVTGPCLEGWSLLAAYAALTTRMRVGLMVTGNTYRHPAVLANIAATVDVISKGRLDFGIGAGWNVREHESYGIPLYKPGERIRRLGEACEIIRLMWTEKAPTFTGKYYQIQEALCEPKPIQKLPPFVIGGGGEQLTLRVVARYADIWNIPGGSVEELLHKDAILKQHCAEIGRDSGEIARSLQLRVNVNDPEAAKAATRPYIEAGVTHFIVILTPPFPEKIAERVAETIIEPLLQEYQ
jgi:F420-dependent oxidoreductase-like protein